MKKTLFFVLFIALLSVGLFASKRYIGDKDNKEKQTVPSANQVPDRGGIMQFTTPSE